MKHDSLPRTAPFRNEKDSKRAAKKKGIENDRRNSSKKYPKRVVISAIIAGAYAQRIYSPLAFVRMLTHSTSVGLKFDVKSKFTPARV
jgi:hypothetical protein